MSFTHTTPDNVAIPRGRVYFAPFLPGTQTPQDSMVYLGNCPAATLTGEVTKLDHFNADTKRRFKDKSFVTQADYGGSITCDNVSDDNLALFLMGSTGGVTQAASAGHTSTFAVVMADGVLQLGRSATNLAGDRGITALTIVDGAAQPLVAGTDYNYDADTGLVHPLVAGTGWVATYSLAAKTIARTVSAGEQVQGALLVVADNTAGKNQDTYMPYVMIAPTGDLTLKGDGTAWQQLQFKLEVLQKDASTPAVIRTGRPV